MRRTRHKSQRMSNALITAIAFCFAGTMHCGTGLPSCSIWFQIYMELVNSLSDMIAGATNRTQKALQKTLHWVTEFAIALRVTKWQLFFYLLPDPKARKTTISKTVVSHYGNHDSQVCCSISQNRANSFWPSVAVWFSCNHMHCSGNLTLAAPLPLPYWRGTPDTANPLQTFEAFLSLIRAFCTWNSTQFIRQVHKLNSLHISIWYQAWCT